MVNVLDRTIVTAVNGFAGRWPGLDRLALVLAGNHLMKGGVVMALVWWAWFCRGGRRHAIERRKTVLATLAAAAAALVFSFVVQGLLPFRPRPIHDPTLGLRVPIGLASDVMANWSSFPSDHATLFFALAAGLFFVSRGLGVVAAAYVTLVIALPRIYVGWHYPSDILGGAIIGATFVALAQQAAVRERLAPPILSWARAHPQAFHAAFFLLSYQVATLMDDARVLASLALHLLRGDVVA
jgi:membrane-associated phospholipid phosphatase